MQFSLAPFQFETPSLSTYMAKEFHERYSIVETLIFPLHNLLTILNCAFQQYARPQLRT